MADVCEYGFYKFRILPGDKIKLTKYRGKDKVVTVPHKLLHYTVSEIGSTAFGGNTNITEVTLPQTLETIEAGSFSECVCLEKINIPPLVTAIERLTFEDCISLEEVKLENKNCRIEENAFVNSNPIFSGEFCPQERL